jgi:hypothetical protein
VPVLGISICPYGRDKNTNVLFGIEREVKNRRKNMPLKKEGKKTTEKVKDATLLSFTTKFGYKKGVELYQSGIELKKIEDSIALLKGLGLTKLSEEDAVDDEEKKKLKKKLADDDKDDLNDEDDKDDLADDDKDDLSDEEDKDDLADEDKDDLNEDGSEKKEKPEPTPADKKPDDLKKLKAEIATLNSKVTKLTAKLRGETEPIKPNESHKGKGRTLTLADQLAAKLKG